MTFAAVRFGYDKSWTALGRQSFSVMIREAVRREGMQISKTSVSSDWNFSERSFPMIGSGDGVTSRRSDGLGSARLQALELFGAQFSNPWNSR